MKLHLARFALPAAMIGAAMLGGCQNADVLLVREAYMRVSPVEANPAALYFTIEGGERDVTLQAVQIANAMRTELHESAKDPANGAMRMQQIREIPVPAGGEVALKPGGRHVMVFGLNTVARRVGATKVIFVFSTGERIVLDVPLRTAGAADADHGAHGG